MKILSFNIWGLPFWPISNKDRIESIANYLRHVDADIVCIQESFDTRYRKMIFDLLKPSGYEIAEYGFDIGQSANHRSENMPKKRRVPLVHMDATGGLVIFSKFPIINSRFFPFTGWNFSFTEWLGRKGILMVLVSTPLGQLCIANTHLCAGHSNMADRVRSRQFGMIMDILKDKTVRNIPIILAGDFNQDNIVGHDQFGIFSKNGFDHHSEYSSAHSVATDLVPSYRKENPYVDNFLNREKNSMRYDYIFTRDISLHGLRVSSYVPVPIDPALSDHDPVLMDLVLT